MQEYGETTEIQKAVGDWLCGYAEDRQPFDEIKHRHTLKEVGDVAEGAYDWKIEKIEIMEFTYSIASKEYVLYIPTFSILALILKLEDTMYVFKFQLRVLSLHHIRCCQSL